MNWTDQQRATLAWLERAVAEGRPFRSIADELVVHLHRGYVHYDWVGVYMVEGEVLRLWSWAGPAPTQHVEIPLHQGLCGWAASTGQVANVPDVRADDRYLQCFLNTRSELVVPITHAGQVYGEIDIDSDQVAAFTAADEAFIGRLCALLGERAAAEGLIGRVPASADR